MNEHLENVIQAYYKTFGLYDVKILKDRTNSEDICVFVDINFRRTGESSHGYSKRLFYDYMSEEELKNELADYFYYTKRDDVPKNELMSEKGIIIAGSIEFKRVKKGNTIIKVGPKFLTSKSKFSINFKKFICDKIDSIGVDATYKELSSIKGLKISRASLYNIKKKIETKQ